MGRIEEVAGSGRGGSDKLEFKKYREDWSHVGDWAGFAYFFSLAERGRKEKIHVDQKLSGSTILR